MRTRLHHRIWPVAVLLGALLLYPSAGTAGKVDQLPAKATQTVFVELSSPPAADLSVADEGAQQVTVKQEQAGFRQAAKAAGIKFSERYAYGKLFNGLSVTVKVTDLAKLSRLPGVVNIYPVVALELPELHSSTEMIRAPEVVADGFDGTGVKVGVIDTGIDYNHPDLGGCLGPGCRVAKGWDFVGKKSL